MNNLFTLCFLFFYCIYLSAEIKVFDKKVGNIVEIYATNTDNFPYTISLKLSTSNVELDRQLPSKILVPPSSSFNILLVKITPKKTNFSYSYKYDYFIGNHVNAKHYDNFAYTIPCDPKYKIMQGYNGKYSHKGKYALDFEMPSGTKILAARSGVVVDIKEDSDKNCLNPNCMHFANYIVIYHEDGSFGAYYHLQKNGVAVSVNQKIKSGQVIGYSGNTGFSSKPHLHFEVYIEEGASQKTLPTKFQTKEGVRFL